MGELIMKKFLALACCFVTAVSLCSCGSSAPTKAINGPDDLVNAKIGVQLGTTGDIYVSDLGEETVVERYNKGAEAVQALKQGKIDAVVIDAQPANVYVTNNTDLQILDEEFTTEDYALCVAKENTALLSDINAAIAELKADGTLQAILDYYIGGEEGAKPYESPAGLAYSGELVMATNAEFPPYEYYEGEDITGADVDFSRAICDKLGKELVISDMNFDSVVASVQTGKADFAAAGLTITEERLQSVSFSDSYCTSSQVIIVKK
jgi:polar amino acid transport system substrate-binding protein